jgi:hypothetical protein
MAKPTYVRDSATGRDLTTASRRSGANPMSPEPMAKTATPLRPRTYGTTKRGRKRLFSPAEASGFGVLGTGVRLLDTTPTSTRDVGTTARNEPVVASVRPHNRPSPAGNYRLGHSHLSSARQGRGPLLDNVHARLPPAPCPRVLTPSASDLSTQIAVDQPGPAHSCQPLRHRRPTTPRPLQRSCR